MSMRKGKCPICRAPATKEDAPFCSDRCRKVDLNRWLSDGYAIPGAEDESAPSSEEYDD